MKKEQTEILNCRQQKQQNRLSSVFIQKNISLNKNDAQAAFAN
jgi:hypothetical protein